MEMRITWTALRTEMMRMWKEIFHDSDDYISLFFDNYFSPGNVFYRLNDDAELIAMMFAIPCDFRCDYLSESLHALYLCGLATDVAYRGRGIMSDMIKDLNTYARNGGFDFTFLIPADTGLRMYYSRLGYKNNMKRHKVIITRDMCDDLDCRFRVITYSGEIDDEIKEDICGYASQSEKSFEGVNIFRNLNGWNVILKEHLQSGGSVVVSRGGVSCSVNGIVFYNSDGVDVNVNFMYAEDRDTACHIIKHIFNTDNNSSYIILSEYVPERMPYLLSEASDVSCEDYGMSYFVRDCENSKSASLDTIIRKNQNLRYISKIPDLLHRQINISMMLD